MFWGARKRAGIEGMEKTMKKLIALLFLGLISVSALGCSEKAATTPTEPAPTDTAPVDTGTEAPAE
jgi:hypothetical protein